MEVSPQIEVRRATAAEVRPFVERACQFLPAGVVADYDDLLAHGEAFVACADGVPFLGYLIEASGEELVVTAAAGRSSFDLVHALSVIADAHAKDFKSIRFHTIRPGFVRRALKYGYTVAAVVDGVYTMRRQRNGE